MRMKTIQTTKCVLVCAFCAERCLRFASLDLLSHSDECPRPAELCVPLTLYVFLSTRRCDATRGGRARRHARTGAKQHRHHRHRALGRRAQPQRSHRQGREFEFLLPVRACVCVCVCVPTFLVQQALRDNEPTRSMGVDCGSSASLRVCGAASSDFVADNVGAV